MRPPDQPISMVGGVPSGPRLTMEAMSLDDLISWAYSVKPWQVTGGPPWAGIHKDRTRLGSGDRRFDISARAEGEAARPIDEFRRMLQTLLAERFRLTLHRESRETPVYALVPDKGGVKLHESAPEAKGTLFMKRGGLIESSGGTITQLVNWFSNANGVDRPVIDQTGLTGKYDFTLEWSNPLASASDSTAPSIFTAMIEQLGLRLEPRKAPVEFLVIDRAEMPDEN
jgi:uncharacterized protein (TIGR03435 family)